MAIYKKNFLDKVIWRIDFEKIALANVAAFHSAIAQSFPIDEQSANEQVSVTIDAQTNNVNTVKETALSWKFHSADRLKRVEIASQYCFIEFDKYIDSNDLMSCISLLQGALVAHFSLKEIARFGLRYLNVIKLEDEVDFVWGKYIQTNLLSGIQIQRSIATNAGIARWMGNIICNLDQQSLNYKFGIWNQDYPANNVRKEFIIDLDCRSSFPFELVGDILVETTKQYNKIIEKAFESSITDNFRSVLNKE